MQWFLRFFTKFPSQQEDISVPYLVWVIHTGLHRRAEPGEFTLSILGSLSIVVVGWVLFILVIWDFHSDKSLCCVTTTTLWTVRQVTSAWEALPSSVLLGFEESSYTNCVCCFSYGRHAVSSAQNESFGTLLVCGDQIYGVGWFVVLL